MTTKTSISILITGLLASCAADSEYQPIGDRADDGSIDATFLLDNVNMVGNPQQVVLQTSGVGYQFIIADETVLTGSSLSEGDCVSFGGTDTALEVTIAWDQAGCEFVDDVEGTYRSYHVPSGSFSLQNGVVVRNLEIIERSNLEFVYDLSVSSQTGIGKVSGAATPFIHEDGHVEWFSLVDDSCELWLDTSSESEIVVRTDDACSAFGPSVSPAGTYPSNS